MTYSIVGADTTAREVGGAGTSCLTGDDVYVIYGGVPGHGVESQLANFQSPRATCCAASCSAE